MQNKAENTSLFYEDNNGGLYKKNQDRMYGDVMKSF